MPAQCFVVNCARGVVLPLGLRQLERPNKAVVPPAKCGNKHTPKQENTRLSETEYLLS